MHALAPAKINLHLRVAKPRDDRFHPLLSWMCTVSLYDTLTFHPFSGRPAGPPSPSLTCSDPSLPTDHTNLVLRAATAIAPHAPLSIHLQKQIPHGAGLGGGSSDAVTTLRAINQYMKLDLGRSQLKTVAATLGSDLPFFFHAPSALCQGRGDLVEPIAPPRPKWAVLVMPDFPIPTPLVYRTFDNLGLGSDLDPHLPDWSTLRADDLLQNLVNDLEPAAEFCTPKLGELRSFIGKMTNKVTRMSGSGSTLFTLYDDPEDATLAARNISTTLNLRAIPVELAPQFRDDLHEDPA